MLFSINKECLRKHVTFCKERRKHYHLFIYQSMSQLYFAQRKLKKKGTRKRGNSVNAQQLNYLDISIKNHLINNTNLKSLRNPDLNLRPDLNSDPIIIQHVSQSHLHRRFDTVDAQLTPLQPPDSSKFDFNERVGTSPQGNTSLSVVEIFTTVCLRSYA